MVQVREYYWVGWESKTLMGRDKGIEPVLFEGLRVMSMSYLSNDATPMVWRGPMASSAVQQILLKPLGGD